MKTKKKQILIISAMVIIILVIVVVLLLLRNVNEENQELDKVMEEITETSIVLEDNIELYNQNREELLELLTDYYSDMLANDYDQYISILKKQEDVIKGIYDNVLVLEKNCGDRLFSQSEVNKVCSNYKEYYEIVVNVYLDDEEQVNELVRSYNEGTDASLDEYHSLEIVDYIDYNGDSEYSGKES